MSSTYKRDKMNKATKRLIESSSGLMDYRARLCYIDIRHKHPKWDARLVKGLAEWKGLFITLFQKPIEKSRARKMKRRLKRAKITH